MCIFWVDVDVPAGFDIRGTDVAAVRERMVLSEFLAFRGRTVCGKNSGNMSNCFLNLIE